MLYRLGVASSHFLVVKASPCLPVQTRIQARQRTEGTRGPVASGQSVRGGEKPVTEDPRGHELSHPPDEGTTPVCVALQAPGHLLNILCDAR